MTGQPAPPNVRFISLFTEGEFRRQLEHLRSLMYYEFSIFMDYVVFALQASFDVTDIKSMLDTIEYQNGRKWWRDKFTDVFMVSWELFSTKVIESGVTGNFLP